MDRSPSSDSAVVGQLVLIDILLKRVESDLLKLEDYLQLLEDDGDVWQSQVDTCEGKGYSSSVSGEQVQGRWNHQWRSIGSNGKRS